MDTKRNQTLEEIEENKIVNEHYQNRIMLIKKLLKTSRLATVDPVSYTHLECSYYRTKMPHLPPLGTSGSSTRSKKNQARFIALHKQYCPIAMSRCV